jgi:hypothetical protein
MCSQHPATGPSQDPEESSPDPHTISSRSILILYSILCLGLLSALFHSCPTKNLKAFFHLHPVCYMPCLLNAHTSSFDDLNNI